MIFEAKQQVGGADSGCYCGAFRKALYQSDSYSSGRRAARPRAATGRR